MPAQGPGGLALSPALPGPASSPGRITSPLCVPSPPQAERDGHYFLFVNVNLKAMCEG